MRAGRARLGLALAAVLACVVPAGAGGQDGDEPARELPIGVVPQRAYGDSDTKAMTAAGIGSVRTWFSWAQIESEPGRLDWSQVDATVATNAKAGLTTLPFVFGTPRWAAELDGWSCPTTETCVSYAPRTEESRAAFAAFMRLLVRRYGPNGSFWRQPRELRAVPIETWQIWNEPNLSSFYAPQVDPAGYAALMQAVTPAIRAEDPKAQVLLGGLTGTKTNAKRMSSARFLTEFYAVPGAAGAFDGIAVHPYNRQVRGALDQVRTTRSIADAHGDIDAELWVTELGWSSAGKRRWGLTKTRTEQARLLGLALERLEQEAERLNLRAVYWYAWRDTERGAAVCGWCPWSGLIDRVGREKPSYVTLQEFANADD